MKPLFELKEITTITDSKLPLVCELCNKIFYLDKKRIKSDIKLGKDKNKFCSVKCHNLSRTKKIKHNCVECSVEIFIFPNVIKKSKTGNYFCSKSCATTYNNKHKTTGTRRSKLERWVEEQLKISHPTLNVLYNDKETINSELDIYIPSLKLAFELNGIFHYEPIFGPEKLVSIKNNDGRKFQACLERGIELVILDTSSLKYFKLKNTQKYLDIIQNIISSKLK